MRGLLHAAVLRLPPGGVLRPRAPEAPLGRRTPKGVPTVPPGNQQGQGQVTPVLLQIIETVTKKLKSQPDILPLKLLNGRSFTP